MSGVPALLRRLGNEFANLLWPAQCIVCGSSADTLEGGVCRKCWGSLLPAPAVEQPKAVDRIAVGFGYDETLRTIIHQFKFNQTPGLARPLADHFRRRLEQMGFVFFDSVIVPVPAHPARRRERGYNPSALLARELASSLDLPFQPGIARRLKHGPHQSSMPDETRQRALKDAFAVQPPQPSLAETVRLVIVDDVTHTGRTIAQLARAARKAGWKHIDAVCLSA